MANARFNQFLFNTNPMLTMIDLQVTLGAVGAVASFSGNGVSNVVKNADGRYTATLRQPFNAYIGSMSQMIAATAGTASGVSTVELTGIPDTAVRSSSVSFQTLNNAGVVANGTSGSKLSISLLLRNSSVSK